MWVWGHTWRLSALRCPVSWRINLAASRVREGGRPLPKSLPGVPHLGGELCGWVYILEAYQRLGARPIEE